MGLFDRFFRKKKNDFSCVVGSPNGRTVLKLTLSQGVLKYAVNRDEKVVVRESGFGFKLREAPDFGAAGLVLIRERRGTGDETWETIVGEEREIRNHYTEEVLYLEEEAEPKRILTLRFRVFDDGVAFRYEIPPQPAMQKMVIAEELTEFNFDLNGQAWKIPAYQPDRYEYNYEKWPVHTLVKSVHTPVTIETTAGQFAAIHEAALYNYGSMTVKLNREFRLQADITPLSDGMRAYVELPFDTPWRVIMIGDTATDLITNRMVLNLNAPPKQDFSWVRPLKFLGIWWAMFVGEWTWAQGERHGATTEHALEYIEACERLGIEGLLIEGWNNGWDGDWLQNGADSNFLEPVDDFDVDRVCRVATEKGIEIIGHHETVGFVDNYEKQMELAYQYYVEHGIHYIKPGYAGTRMTIGGRKEFHHSQVGVKHYQRAVELAAKYEIMLDVHEPIKGTGIERTWPNLLTREGARGQEYEGGALVPSHMCILPFTRLLAGGMDYTPGILDVANAAKRLSSTLARQLALYVVVFSGMTMAADRPFMYEEKYPDAYEFIRSVPINWEVTVPLLGKIGEYYVVARKDRESENWYVGGVTNEDGRKVRVSLEFLGEGEYVAEVYKDGAEAHYRANPLSYTLGTRRVSKVDVIEIDMAPGGGFAIRLSKA